MLAKHVIPIGAVEKALAASATTARAFQQQRGAVAAACFDLIALYLATSITKPCNKIALDAIRQALILRLRGAKIGKVKVM